MPGFNYSPRLIGKLLKTYDDNYALIYADTNKDPLIVPDSKHPLVGVRFDNVSTVIPESWDYEGNCKSGAYGHDIIKVLEEDDVVRLNNLKLLSEAFYDQRPSIGRTLVLRVSFPLKKKQIQVHSFFHSEDGNLKQMVQI